MKDLNRGTEVSGMYYDKKFSGVIVESRRHTVRNDLIIVTVALNTPLELYGSLRYSILVDYFTNGDVNPHACLD